MSHNGISIFEQWRKISQLISEERDEEKQKELLKQLRHSYQEEVARLGKSGM